ncbi:hypothetical protein BDR03DRAFT_498952 [Suillus americanus]|nr:hypothetical protein BDR03DRAFT_498952 [Suillus americanus]
MHILSIRHISMAASKHHVRIRAFVSLCHQCDTFVTPENLSQKIDEAFVPQRNSVQLQQAEMKRLFTEREEELRHFFGKDAKPSPTGLRVALAIFKPRQ